MKLVLTLLVRDEIDVVEQNLRFHLDRGVDHVIATDNGSVDGTRDVLLEFARQGVLDLIDEPTQDYSQAVWVSRMALMARDERDADWILNCDADEFWYTSRGDLKTALREPDIDILVCPRRNMVCAADREDEGPWAERLRYRVRTPVPPPDLEDALSDPFPEPYYYWDLLPKVLCRAEGLQSVGQGNHHVAHDRARRAVSDDIVVYHYPFRSREQFLRKVRQGGAAYTRNQSLPLEVGWHWRRWHRMLEGGREVEVLAEILPDDVRLRNDLEDGVLVESDILSSILAARNKG